MPIGYDPKDASLVWPAGEYEATLDSVAQKTSKAGNEMYVLTFTVYSNDRTMQVVDYIVFPAFTWKLKRLARAFGVEEAFGAGTFDPETCCSHNLSVTLAVDPARDGYDEKNIIRGYAPKGGKVVADPYSDLPF